jgi:hypothetical protein
MPLQTSDVMYLRRTIWDFGVTPGEQGLNYQDDSFVGNGSQTNFVLSHTPSSLYDIYVYVNQVLLTSGYSLSGSVVSLSVAPANLATLSVVYSY